MLWLMDVFTMIRSGYVWFLFSRPEDLHRIRVEHMERQLANLTGLVQKALTQKPAQPVVSNNQSTLGLPAQYRSG